MMKMTTKNALLDSTGATINIGSSIGTWVRDTGVANWNRYAAVNDEFVPIHMDDEAGREAGMPGAFGMGNLQISYLHGLVREWMGPHGQLRNVSLQFRKPNTRGTVTASGRVTAITAGEEGTAVELEIWTKDEAGNVLAPGTAIVTFS